MERIAKILWTIAVIVFASTAILTLVGVGYVWFVDQTVTLPHLEMLITSLIVEVLAVCILVLKNSVDYAPKTKIYKNKEKINEFLTKFAVSGSSVEFVSNRASWLKANSELRKKIIEKAISGDKVGIYTSNEPVNSYELEDSGIDMLYNFSEDYTPNARFTLLNSSRQGAEQLAIAIGSFPKHKVYVFEGKHSPFIIGMAKDIISLMKEIERLKNEKE